MKEMEITRNRKAYFYFGVGTVFMALIVLYVVISLINTNLATEILNAIKNLFLAFRGQ